MKKISFFAAAATVLLGSCNTNANLQGNITDVESDTLLLYITSANTGNWLEVDTIPLKDGHFEATLPDTVLLNLYLSPKNKYGEQKAQILEEEFLFFPGDHMTVEGSFAKGLKATDTELYDLLTQDENYALKTVETQRAYKALQATDMESENADSIEMVYDQAKLEQDKAALNFIKTNPDSRAAGYLALDLGDAIGVEAIAHLSESIRSGIMKTLIDDMLSYYEENVEIEKQRANIQPGKMAPDFKLIDLDGKAKSLADFKGKYAVLDFWGTWCGWCLHGIPMMKSYYDKYKNDVEFVGICCADQKERWRKCVNKNKMDWTNLFNGENEKTQVAYGVSGYPTKILIDPQGKIDCVFEGESSEFYEYLDTLFEKKK